MDSVENNIELVEITAEAEQNSGWWTARATNHDLPPATARSLSSVTTQLRKIAADLLDMPRESVHVQVTTQLPDNVQQLVSRAEEQRQTADEATRSAQDSLIEAAAELRHTGWPIRDIAARLRMSSKTLTGALANSADTDEG